MKSVPLFEDIANVSIEEIEKFIKDNSYLDLDDNTENSVTFSTRENGDVGEETHGVKDLVEANKVKRLVKEKFPNVKADIETVDEWVMLTVTIS